MPMVEEIRFKIVDELLHLVLLGFTHVESQQFSCHQSRLMMGPLYVTEGERMDFVRESNQSLNQFVFVRNPHLVLHKLEVRRYILNTDWGKLAWIQWIGRVEDVADRRVYRAKTTHFMHNDLIGAECDYS